jgi:tetraacyldisaccharide 4'-kinase
MSLTDDLRARVARRLERGSRGLLARAAAAAWGAWSARGVARPLELPSGVRSIGVGSAVLGGAGKTPLAVALACELARRGERVAIVGHAYRAAPHHARVVAPSDRPEDVGDDALSAARLLAATGASVIVAPRRQQAVDHAAALGFSVLLIDGLLQAAPDRLSDAILVLDAAAPWGSGACPPAGDLRAPREALLAAADHLAVITSAELPPGLDPRAIAIPSSIAGATSASGERHSLDALAKGRMGLLVTVARPTRIEAALRRAGIAPAQVIALGDHATPSARDLALAERAAVAAWLTTSRCAVKLPAAIGRAPVLALDHRLLVGALCERFAVTLPRARAPVS